MPSVSPLAVSTRVFSPQTARLMCGLWSSEIWLEHAWAGSPEEERAPSQNSFPGSAFPSHAYETTRSLPLCSAGRLSWGFHLEKRTRMCS